MIKNNHKLGVIVPYRNRYEQLLTFKEKISDYLTQKGVNFELIVVEQNDEKTFNRGKLLNIGFKIAKRLKCNYVAFHDVDMLPVDVDYSYTDKPLHLATNFISVENMSRIVFDEYFGGVTLFPTDVFEKINGYSNEYWGWGYEDDDLLYRCRLHGVNLFEKSIKMMGGNTAAIKFNGENGYVKLKNNLDLTKPITLFISFYPDNVICDYLKYDDKFVIFSSPRNKLSISYNSYKKYNFELYDVNDDVIYINSDVKINYKTNICVTLDPNRKEVSMYQDGNLIETKTYEGELVNNDEEQYMYIGCGSSVDNETTNYFRGLFSSFAAFRKKLKIDEIKELSNNQFFGLTQNFGEYTSSISLTSYYDAKFIKHYKLIDLSDNNNDGEINNSDIVGYTFDNEKIIRIPHRRESTFELLSHEENGFVNGAWKDITTRYNQMKFYNEVSIGSKNPNEDGLNNCIFKEISNVRVENETHIVVSV